MATNAVALRQGSHCQADYRQTGDWKCSKKLSAEDGLSAYAGDVWRDRVESARCGDIREDVGIRRLTAKSGSNCGNHTVIFRLKLAISYETA